ncbi:WD40/YVTN/BNR-like repeat-containing protein [Nannocystis radixulma]|uniref:Photosynthesis system II assembly factor Ycf48/Hcf136-like domain-containing protein n=1 Tax=Nannocystis radixulma TaxID=2995305 RepID=A0ABT5BK31_9BACT|nr:hypothetical protein [Nannocystis radixulma]MDC0674510.1 hypothetical protein [Nannocystis radixulma]
MFRVVVASFALSVTGCIFFPPAGGTDSDGGTAGEPPSELFIAVGDGGSIVRSENGADWTISTSGVTVALNDVAYGAEMYVAVGQAGKILHSEDGVEWNASSSPSTRDLYAVRYHGTRFVAVGGDYSVGAETLESEDGITWTRPDLPMPKHMLVDLTGDGVTLVAIGNYQAEAMNFGAFNWQDGVGWVQRIDGSPTGDRYSAIGHGAPNFAMIGPSKSAYSGDGLTWNYTPLFNLAADPRGLTYGPGGWVAVGGGGQILGSSDAITWLVRASPFMTTLLDVASDGQRHVAVGAGGNIAYSPDSLTWTAVTPPVTADLRGIAHTRQ